MCCVEVLICFQWEGRCLAVVGKRWIFCSNKGSKSRSFPVMFDDHQNLFYLKMGLVGMLR